MSYNSNKVKVCFKTTFCGTLCPNPEVLIYAKVVILIHSTIVIIILTFYVLITYGVIQFSYNCNNNYNKTLKFQCHKNQMLFKGSALVFQKLFITGYGQLKK